MTFSKKILILILLLFVIASVVRSQDFPMQGNYSKIDLNSTNSVSLFQSTSTSGIWASGMVTGDRWAVFEDATSAKERLTITAGGRVGIGINNPPQLFSVRDSDLNSAGVIASFGSSNIEQGLQLITSDGNLEWGLNALNSRHLVFQTYQIERMRITNSGNVGIGTNAPQSKLHIYEKAVGEDVSVMIQNRSTWDPNATSSLVFTHNVNNYSGGKITSEREGHYKTSEPNTAKSSLVFYTAKYAVDQEQMRITSDGRVGIGTPTPDEKLTVKGKIHAEEVRVDLNVPHPDYVFSPSYKLPTLEEVKRHIEEKGHLPNIPSAAEVEKDGLNLGEMNAKLLEKIEEQMLYILELKENNDSQNEQLNIQKKTINQLIERIEKLENK